MDNTELRDKLAQAHRQENSMNKRIGEIDKQIREIDKQIRELTKEKNKIAKMVSSNMKYRNSLIKKL